MRRDELLAFLVEEVLEVNRPHPIRIAIDGVDASGKTTLANELAEFLRHKGFSVIRASIDGFHNPKEMRYRLGAGSPEGYYKDSFNYELLKENLLIPLGERGSLKYKTAVYDFRTESEVSQSYKEASNDAFLIFDGVFLLRPEIREYWDYSIYVHSDFNVILKRASLRDQYLFGSSGKVEKRYREKYIPGQKLYLKEAKPILLADVVIDNNDYNQPEIVFSDKKKSELLESTFNFV
ncbi:hypothetical protein [Kosmotoga pacifica]|uniref:Phosphoribulokinase/uridine kinase domain-containing protein n=1 Tax=Kosmotoga pacifica TaxID=1330330 RepID=A0A0G2ZDN7_9BACT|nr:hypothetical protein [Kosmotoga pacifica]AKI97654.1 hypothetical protein IX53_07310 [Kosmotoga pacifica]